MYALIMDLPDAKRPGFYAQIVKALAADAPPFDRDKDLLIYDEPLIRDEAGGIMNKYHVEYEELELILLDAGTELAPTFTDFGLVTRLEHAYVYADQILLFRLSEGTEDNRRLALLQMEEHLQARSTRNGESYYAVEAHLADLMSGIAKAYNCSIQLID
ncbi:hypothetical protein [Paenibacillus thalictri]|nr:hypothetical protein [Paenibacillus thalictri]